MLLYRILESYKPATKFSKRAARIEAELHKRISEYFVLCERLENLYITKSYGYGNFILFKMFMNKISFVFFIANDKFYLVT